MFCANCTVNQTKYKVAFTIDKFEKKEQCTVNK